MRHFYLIMLFVMVTILQSCTNQLSPDVPFGNRGDVNIKLSTKSLQLLNTSVKTVRIIVCDKEGYNVWLNELNPTDISTTTDVGSFVIKLPAGSYTFYTIANEPDNLTTTLNELRSKAELASMKIQPATPFVETTTMLSQQKDAVVAIDDQGVATIDGRTTPLSMELERVSTKVSLTIKKQTVDPEDKFTIKKVDFVQSPTYSYLEAQVYDGATFVSRELFNGAIEFSTNGEQKEIVKETPAGTIAEPSNIFAEYLLAAGDASTHAKAAYFDITATYTPRGSSARDVHYAVPVGNYQGDNTVNGAGHDYNLKRNYHYAMNVNISKQGEKNAVEIKYTVEPWKSRWIDVEIEGDPFLDVSNVAVDVYDAAATRIYFYSNMPIVELDPNLLNGTQFIPVNDNFASLTGAGAENFTYIYDPVTKRGEGYLDLINVHTDNVVNIKRLLYLRSGKLVREIAATTRISPEAAKNNGQRYVGTFHRANERSERIVTWYLPPATQWRVEIVKSSIDDGGTPGASYYADAAHLRIDHLASPNHSQLYTLNPPNAEGAFVTDDDRVTKLVGRDRIYFRVGWASVIGVAEHRFAKIKVTTSTDGFTTQTVNYLYCRQGEEPEAIVSLSTVFSCYNISTPERFVDYPTKTGFLYQWNRSQSWEVTGIANNYPKGDRAPASDNSYQYRDYDPQTDLCPSRYAYPDGNALDVVKNALNPANVMYQWGYYADGFFDRRAVNEHIVRSASGEIASAGGMFFSRNTAVTIFLPTASWRDDNGEINAKTDHHQLGVIGHYWTQPQAGEWSNTRALATPQINAWTLHLSTAGSPDSYLELLNKASAASVRCMRLEGRTVYFDANGGLSAPRSITKESGTITFPAGPGHKDNSLTFLNWASTRSGTGVAYNAGDIVDIADVGEKTFYANYQKYYTVNGKYFFVSKAEAKSLIWSDADKYCKYLTPANSWHLPTRAELEGIYPLNPVLFTGGYWTSTVSTRFEAPDYIDGHYFLSSGASYATTDDSPWNVRCVREFTK